MPLCWIRRHPFFAKSVLHLQTAVFVPKCSCSRFLLESHLLIASPCCKWPFGMATIYFEHVSNPSFSLEDTTHCPTWLKPTVLLDLGAAQHLSHGCWARETVCFPFYMFILSLKRPPTFLLKIGQPQSLMASDRLSDPLLKTSNGGLAAVVILSVTWMASMRGGQANHSDGVNFLTSDSSSCVWRDELSA